MGAALLGLRCVWCVVSPVCQCVWCLQAGVQVHGIVQFSVLLLCSYCCLLSDVGVISYTVLYIVLPAECQELECSEPEFCVPLACADVLRGASELWV